VLVAQLDASVDDGVNDQPAGIGLVGIPIDLEVFAQPVGDRLPVLLGTHHSGPTAPCFDALKRTGVTFLREEGGEQTILRRAEPG